MPAQQDSTVHQPRILLADDQPTVLQALQLLLKQEGYRADSVTRPVDVLSALRTQEYDLVVMDLNYSQDTTSGMEGLDLLSGIRRLEKEVPLVVMTAWGNMDLAIEAMRRGARDFIQKPWKNQQVLQILKAQIEQGQRGRDRRQEMEEARAVQQVFLQGELPQLRGFQFCAGSRSARELGGDYFEAQRLTADQATLCIGDVAGKGLPAALLMASLQAGLRSLPAGRPAAVCAELNRLMCQIVPLGRFVSFFYCVLDGSKRELTYCNAGHNPPVLVRADGRVLRPESNDAVLGYFRDWQYREQRVGLQPGDRLVLFTDGITDATDDAGVEFGDERVVSTAVQHRTAGAAELHQVLMSAVCDHCGDHLMDDTTLVVVGVE